MRFIVENAIDNASLSTIPTVCINTPVEHLQEVSRAKVFRTNASESPYIQTILGNITPTQNVSCLILGRHNITYTGVTIKLSEFL